MAVRQELAGYPLGRHREQALRRAGHSLGTTGALPEQDHHGGAGVRRQDVGQEDGVRFVQALTNRNRPDRLLSQGYQPTRKERTMTKLKDAQLRTLRILAEMDYWTTLDELADKQ